MTDLQKLITVLRPSSIGSYRATGAFFPRHTVAYLLVSAILLAGALLVHLFPAIQTTGAAASASTLLPPALGNYPNMTVALSGDIRVAPDAIPTDATSINVSTSTNFKGTLTTDAATGLVRVTNAHPAGAYSVAVRAFGTGGAVKSRTFTLTVRQGSACVDELVFTKPGDVSVDSHPASVAIGDFNNDGQQDLAVANASSDSVSIRLGNGLGLFNGSTNVSVDKKPKSVAIGDFDNDGNQDFATANYDSHNVSIRLGDGLGNFNGSTNIGVGSYPNSVAIGDFNNDGNQDFATFNLGSPIDWIDKVSIRFGDGLGAFSGGGPVPDINSIHYGPYSVAIGDFNNDGNQDLANPNYHTTVSIRLGNGTGEFGSPTTTSAGNNPYSVAVGDFNNDGDQDLATTNYWTSSISIRLGDGAGGFSNPTTVGVGSAPYSLAIGDFNNDGNQDLATADNLSDNNVSIHLGNGQGGFSGTMNVSVASTPVSVAIGDFNNDGQQDFATANRESNSVSIRLGYCGRQIVFGALSDKTYGDADFNISATASSDLPVSFSASGNCRVNANLVHLTGAGQCTITASQAGDSDHLPIPDVTQTFTIFKAPSMTSVICLTNVPYTGSPLTPCSAKVTGAGGLNQELAVNYDTENINAGLVIASAGFAGNANYNVSGSWDAFTIDKAVSTTKVTCPAKVTYTGSPLTPCSAKVTGAPGLYKELTVDYSNNTKAGMADARASFAGDANYAASSDSPKFTIDKANQTITFDALPNRTLGDPDPKVSAKASSGLPVFFAAGSTGNCYADGSIVRLTGVGLCRIGAYQPGDSNYNPAQQVERTFNIGPKP